MKVPSSYKNYAQHNINEWNRFLLEGKRHFLTKTQYQEAVLTNIANMQAADGDPATWTDCPHCEGEGWYRTPATDQEQREPDYLDKVEFDGTIVRGLCFQCHGKGRQSEADRRRNWGYVARKED